MTTVLIGAPIYDRAWILPYWFRAIERQDFPTDKLGFVFELGPHDDETHDLLWSWHERHPEFMCFQGDIEMKITHRSHPEGLRYWDQIRYLKMAEMRNNLLDRAIAMSDRFDYYLSLDSDILLKDRDTINRLIAYSEQYPNTVVAPLAYMTPDSEEYPNVMSWEKDWPPGIKAERRLEEYPMGQPFIADVVMAAVLMPKSVYTQARYRGHTQGEDLGFAVELMRRGFKSLAATDIYTPHIMHRYMVEQHVNNWLTLQQQ